MEWVRAPQVQPPKAYLGHARTNTSPPKGCVTRRLALAVTYEVHCASPLASFSSSCGATACGPWEEGGKAAHKTCCHSAHGT